MGLSSWWHSMSNFTIINKIGHSLSIHLYKKTFLQTIFGNVHASQCPWFWTLILNFEPWLTMVWDLRCPYQYRANVQHPSCFAIICVCPMFKCWILDIRLSVHCPRFLDIGHSYRYLCVLDLFIRMSYVQNLDLDLRTNVECSRILTLDIQGKVQ